VRLTVNQTLLETSYAYILLVFVGTFNNFIWFLQGVSVAARRALSNSFRRHWQCQRIIVQYLQVNGTLAVHTVLAD